MPVPDFQSFFLPLLEFAGDGAEHSLSKARDFLKHSFDMTDEDFAELLPSGKQSKYANRIHCATS